MTATRQTQQRAAIFNALDDAEGFQSAQELHDEMNRRGTKVGLATVYRTLQTLADAGDLDVVLNESGETIYRRCESAEHHHHLVCRGCGTSVELPSQEIEKWASTIARRYEFTEITHVAELFGSCRACSTAS
ncbi:MAG: Fur family transcriptional regulator, ferric uptake regulator [Actinomycetota bacterium]|jgi:Fur family ferric uptake transcriptional regulator|nr:Fur family transcriptional regulator, ferric uptake regulator [Actinomycetota bacterium]